jgi:lipopolysaccharide transport system ATP-binding protein
MQPEPVIEVQNLGKAYTIYRRPEDRFKQMLVRWKKYYEEYWALRDVSLTIRRGETVGIIGRNGSGKSTLLQMMCGTLGPTNGSVKISGRVAGLLELGAGFNPDFTGRENVFLAASVLGLTDQEIKERFSQITEFAGIGDFIDQPVKVYSSGMYARLAFAVAAHVDADILIVDEILAVGDAAFTQKCMRFIRKFKDQGTLLIVTHDTSAVLNLCDRVIWIDRGRLREEGNPKEICDNYLASLQTEMDDGSSLSIQSGGRRADATLSPADHRHEAIAPLHRDAVKVFDFDPDASWFGARGATVESVHLLNAAGGMAQTLSGGEEVTLRISCLAHVDIERPIVGFHCRDRLGQGLFGDNTYLTYQSRPMHIAAGNQFSATFSFRMPYLPTGDYSINVAVADGTQDDHVQQHWIDDAMFFRVTSSHVVRGLMGIPMTSIAIDVVPAPRLTD